MWICEYCETQNNDPNDFCTCCGYSRKEKRTPAPSQAPLTYGAEHIERPVIPNNRVTNPMDSRIQSDTGFSVSAGGKGMRYPLNENRETWTADKGKGGRKAGNKSKLWVCVAIVFLVLIAVSIIGVLSGRKNDQSLKQILSAEVSEETVQPAEQKATAAAPKEDDKPNGQKATAAAVADKYYGQYKVSDWKLITTAEETLSYVNLAESFTTEEQRRVNVFLGTSLNRVCC